MNACPHACRVEIVLTDIVLTHIGTCLECCIRRRCFQRRRPAFIGRIFGLDLVLEMDLARTRSAFETVREGCAKNTSCAKQVPMIVAAKHDFIVKSRWLAEVKKLKAKTHLKANVTRMRWHHDII